MNNPHSNWFFFSIIFWSGLNFINGGKKNDRIYTLLNNFLTLLFISISFRSAETIKKFPEFEIHTWSENITLDIFSLFIVHFNIGFLIMDSIVNYSFFYNLPLIILLFGYVLEGYFSYLLNLYYYYQFVEMYYNLKILLDYRDKYFIYFNIIIRFIWSFCLFSIYFTNDIKIPIDWSVWGSISIFTLIIFNFYVICLLLEDIKLI